MSKITTKEPTETENTERGYIFIRRTPSTRRLTFWDFCELTPHTKDGFLEMEIQTHWEAGPDPPSLEGTCDPSHWEDISDSPLCTDCRDPPHWNY